MNAISQLHKNQLRFNRGPIPRISQLCNSDTTKGICRNTNFCVIKLLFCV